MRFLVFGRTGQVALELQKRLPQNCEAVFLGRDQADFEDAEACVAFVQNCNADIVINAVAYTAVDKAESEEAKAVAINATTPGVIAKTCASRGIPILHISTDYVFAGSGTHAQMPDQDVAPLNAYGRSKNLGEITIRQSGARHVILRTSWVFSAHGANFVKTMLRLGKQKESLSVVADQIGGPTSAAAIADTLYALARQMHVGHKGGTYHFSGTEDTSWADFAVEIFKQSKLNCAVQEIPTSQYPLPAKRPLNSRLDCTSLAQDFGIERPNWRSDLTDVIKVLGEFNAA